MAFKASWLIIAVLALPALAGCVTPEDAGANVPPAETTDDPAPVPELPDLITKLIPVAQADVPVGAGIWVEGNYAYVSGLGSGFHVVNVSDPENPHVVGAITESFFGRDVDFIAYEDGRLVALVASEGGGLNFIEVTDPTNPTLLSTIEATDSSAHNVARVPGTYYVYNSGSGGVGDDIDVIDATNPDAPVQVSSWGTHGCHDITFFMDDENAKYRAYCAAIEETQIWDIADPTAGVFIASFTNPAISAGGAVAGRGGLDPGLHHLAMVNHDATVLIVGDEFTGGIGPGCGANTPLASSPLGALWFYDITDETSPELMSWIAPDVPASEYADTAAGTTPAPDSAFNTAFGLSCTAHFGDLIPDREMLVMSWYRAGVLLIDFTDASAPRIVDQWNPGTSTWDVKYANGHLYTGDMNRGLDVLTLG